MRNYITFSRLGPYGHLGNQLFQFSTVYSYAKRKNKNIVFTKDKKNTRFFECFDPNCDISFVDSLSISSSYTEKRFSYNHELWNSNVDDLVGYFQSEKYFVDYIQDLKNIFTFKQSVSPIPDHVFIHVRRGDYLIHPKVHPLCPEEYYSKAIDVIKTKYGSQTKFMVFSDDIHGASEYKCFKQNNIYFSSDTPFIALHKMKTCLSGIIANSSFSWWGAWFIENKHKTTIAPREWFGAGGPQDSSDIYCKDWITL